MESRRKLNQENKRTASARWAISSRRFLRDAARVLAAASAAAGAGRTFLVEAATLLAALYGLLRCLSAF